MICYRSSYLVVPRLEHSDSVILLVMNLRSDLDLLQKIILQLKNQGIMHLSPFDLSESNCTILVDGYRWMDDGV
jgi:hypothetical protein